MWPRDLGSFEAIVVGAGPAGSVCAARLAEAGRQTLLIEAGPRAQPAAAATGLMPPSDNDESQWYWPAVMERPRSSQTVEPWSSQRRLGGSGASGGDRPLSYLAGRGLGGGSAVNGMLLSTGSDRDYDRWAAAGCSDWSAADMAPWVHKAIAVMKPERLTGVQNSAVQNSAVQNSVVAAFDAAAKQFGWESVIDSTLNGDALGLLDPALSAANGRRRSTADAYLGSETNGCLTIWTDTAVERLELAGRRVSGVRLADGSLVRCAQIVLTAGAVGSPRLLCRSGFDSGVGAFLKNHAAVVSSVPWPSAELSNQAPLVRRVLRFDVDASGQRAIADHNRKLVEIQLMGPFAAPGSEAELFGILLLILLEPTSSGRLQNCGSGQPVMVSNRLEAEEDRAALRQALPVLMAIGNSIRGAGSGARFAGVDLSASSADLDQWLLANQGPVFHAVGTCRMGVADRCPVAADAARFGQVKGADGLFVADTSIFPDLVSGGLQLPVTAVAERVVASLISNW